MTHSFESSGGATSSGSASYSVQYSPSVSGGATSSGSAGESRSFSCEASGGCQSAGTATTSVILVYSPSGGGSTGGSSSLLRTIIYTPSGEVVSSGESSCSYIPGVIEEFLYSGSGGVETGSSCRVTFTPVLRASRRPKICDVEIAFQRRVYSEIKIEKSASVVIS